MRLIAVQELTYLGRDIMPGALFDAWEDDGRDMVNRDAARPFGLEDPSTRPLHLILAGMEPPEEPEEPTQIAEPTLSPDHLDAPAHGNPNFQFQVNTDGSPTEWTAISSDAWLWVVTPTEPVTGDGPVTGKVMPNTTDARTGSITITGLGLMFTVNQSAGLKTSQPMQ